MMNAHAHLEGWQLATYEAMEEVGLRAVNAAAVKRRRKRSEP